MDAKEYARRDTRSTAPSLGLMQHEVNEEKCADDNGKMNIKMALSAILVSEHDPPPNHNHNNLSSISTLSLQNL